MMTNVENNGVRLSAIGKVGLLRTLIAVVVIIVGISATYHATIYGLKVDLSRKADAETVIQIKQQLVRIETILNERMATKTQLLEVRDLLSRRLTSIEKKLNQ